MLYAQLTHSIGLNDVCDSLRLHSGPLSVIRGATPPSRNGLSHAGKQRKAVLAEKIFWAVLRHLQTLSPGFMAGVCSPYCEHREGFAARIDRAMRPVRRHVDEAADLHLLDEIFSVGRFHHHNPCP